MDVVCASELDIVSLKKGIIRVDSLDGDMLEPSDWMKNAAA